ncbi:MAG: response regulator [Polyangiaceae bacterium]
MSTKVLVFESDPAFAGELRTELGKLGCTTTVVEDGNVGLQQAASDRPDLILLSIELPRMNGFSVCNKLKKDAGLKEVPLIIMSSESSEETFDQHKKLRTRAEDYVHKPIAFGELLQHIQGFVQIGADAASEAEAAIVIEEDIDASEYLTDDEAVSADSQESLPQEAPAEAPPKKVDDDDDVDAFAESAFGRLTEPEGAVAAAAPMAQAVQPTAASNGAAEARAPRRSVAPSGRTSVAPAPRTSVRPAAAAPVVAGIDKGEHERVLADLAKARERAAAVETELAQAQREIDKLKLDAGEAELLQREVEELKTKIAAGAKGGAVSSREFLDLREGLNKKDKEILALRDQLTKKDREIVQSQDNMLALERTKADLDDRLLALESELADAKVTIESTAGEAEKTKKAGDELRSRLDKAVADGQAKDKALEEARSKAAADISALEAKVTAAKTEAEQALASERAQHGMALDEAEARRVSEIEQATRALDAALVEAGEKATRDQAAAIEARAAQLASEHADKIKAAEAAAAQELSAAGDAHEAALEKARAEASETARESDRRHAEELAAARKDADDRIAHAAADAAQREKSAVEGLKAEHAERVSAIENDRDARIATLESKTTREVGEANERLAKLDAELSGVRGELEALRETKRDDDQKYAVRVAELERAVAEGTASKTELETKLNDRDARLSAEAGRADRAQAKWEADKQSLDRAKDALAVALVQIEEAEGRS